MSTNTEPGFAVSVKGISKTYSHAKTESLVLKDLSFEVASGEVLAICGLSGVGKSTLLRIIAGLIPATSGAVFINGEEVLKPSERMGFVTQDYSRSLFPWLNVAHNVALPFKGHAVPKPEQAERVKQVLISVGLGEASSYYPWQLSGGMQQRVAIARALVMKPRLLLLDEPFASVDAHVRLELEDLVAHLVEENSITTILVTHDVDEAVYLADRAITLTGAPARVGMELEIDLVRPRIQVFTRADAQFSRLRNQLYLGLRS